MTHSDDNDSPLLVAARGHLIGLGNSIRTFDERLRFLGADPDEVKALCKAIEELRDPACAPSKTAAYQGGFLDGFALALASARAEAGS